MSLYDSTISDKVSTPGGLVSDGLRLYWTNSEAGTTAGLAVQGEVEPKAPLILACPHAGDDLRRAAALRDVRSRPCGPRIA